MIYFIHIFLKLRRTTLAMNVVPTPNTTWVAGSEGEGKGRKWGQRYVSFLFLISILFTKYYFQIAYVYCEGEGMGSRRIASQTFCTFPLFSLFICFSTKCLLSSRLRVRNNSQDDDRTDDTHRHQIQLGTRQHASNTTSETLQWRVLTRRKPTPIPLMTNVKGLEMQMRLGPR
jgi:hypothetical protein